MTEHQIRRANLIALFRAFASEYIIWNESGSTAGVDTAFAERIQVQTTALSSMKSGARQIGPTLARQIEGAFGKPRGWLDEDHGESLPSVDKELNIFLKIARDAFLVLPHEEQKKLKRELQQVVKDAKGDASKKQH